MFTTAAMVTVCLYSELALDGSKANTSGLATVRCHDGSSHQHKLNKSINTVKLEMQSSLHNSNTTIPTADSVMVIQGDDDDPVLLHDDSLATPPTTPIHQNKFTPRKSPRLTQTTTTPFDPTMTLYACGSSRPCTALSLRPSDNTRYPYGNPYTARTPRVTTTNPLYHVKEEPHSDKQCLLNTDSFLRVYRYESRNKTPSSYTTSSSKQPSPSIRIPYTPAYSEDSYSNRSSTLGHYQRVDGRLLSVKNPIRTPPPTANSTTTAIVKSNTSIGSITIPELSTS